MGHPAELLKQIPENAKYIYYGASLPGKGSLWVGDDMDEGLRSIRNDASQANFEIDSHTIAGSFLMSGIKGDLITVWGIHAEAIEVKDQDPTLVVEHLRKFKDIGRRKVRPAD